MTQCSCGLPFEEYYRDNALAAISHGSRRGHIWLSNNETYLNGAYWQYGHGKKHVGTFKTFSEAFDALTRSMTRSQH